MVAGRCAYPASPTTLRLAGRHTLTLTEFGAHGSPAATFATTIPGTKNTVCDVTRGTETENTTAHRFG